MKTKGFLLIIILIFSTAVYSADIKIENFVQTEVPVYKLKPGGTQMMLYMAYAGSTVKNQEVWENKNKDKKVYEVDLVFTGYPKRKEDWITNFDRLLQKRIESLIKLEPSLGDSSVKWNFILQTKCNSEEEAKKMFHGAVFKFNYKKGYADLSNISLKKFDQNAKYHDWGVVQNQVEGIVLGLTDFEDSSVFKAINRNHWGKMLVITDWTGSMYQHGAQVVLWHRLNFDRQLVKSFVFFNDGNMKPDKQKRIGTTGGVFHCKPDSFEYILKVMNVVMKLGCGGDTPENNLEATLKGIKLNKEYDEIVMIADNNAGVRDMWLLEKVKKPIRVVLCGVDCGVPIHPHYLEIARKTGGSVHTIEQDINNLAALREGQMIDINGILYKLKKGKLVKLKAS